MVLSLHHQRYLLEKGLSAATIRQRARIRRSYAAKTQARSVTAAPDSSFSSTSTLIEKVGDDEQARSRRRLSFFDLSPELRNLIYQHTLLEYDSVEISSSFVIPGLLSVNRQIRSEALEVFYIGNSFRVLAPSCDGTLMLKWILHTSAIVLTLPPPSSSKQKRSVTVTFDASGNPHWDKLEAWLLWRWQYGVPFEHLDVQGKESFGSRVVCTAHNLLNRFLGQPWSVFEDVLMDYKAIVFGAQEMLQQ